MEIVFFEAFNTVVSCCSNETRGQLCVVDKATLKTDCLRFTTIAKTQEILVKSFTDVALITDLILPAEIRDTLLLDLYAKRAVIQLIRLKG